MLPIVIAILLATNTITAFYLNQKYKKQLTNIHQRLALKETVLSENEKENKLIKQELADLKYQYKVLEKDLASAKR